MVTRGIASQLLRTGTTLFFTYATVDTPYVRVNLWLDDGGAVLRTDTIGYVGAWYAYARSDTAVLVEGLYPFDWADPLAFVVHPFSLQSGALPPDTIYQENVAYLDIVAGVGFDDNQGELIVLFMIGREVNGQRPGAFTGRLLRYTPGATQVYPEQTFEPYPIDEYVTRVTPAFAPNGKVVVACQREYGVTRNRLSFLILDEDGELQSVEVSLPLEPDLGVGGLHVVVYDATVYTCFGLFDVNGSDSVGAFLQAFPLDALDAAHPPFFPHPSSFSLSAYPNPFNATTTLTFSLPRDGKVELKVYDVTGRLAKTLADEMMSAGEHRLTVDGSDLASGVYLASLTTADQTTTEKLMLLK